MPRPNRGPYVHPEPNSHGIYEIRWTDGGRSRRRSTGASDYRQAQKILANFILLKEDEAVRAEARGPYLVRQALGDPGADEGKSYWHEHVLEKVIDKESARYAIAKLTRHFGHMAATDILPENVAAYVKARREGKIGRPSVDHTISKELAFLNAALNHAAKARRVDKAALPHIALPGTSPPRDRWLTREEADRLLAAALRGQKRPEDPLPRIYRFVALGLGTASRKGALLQLQRKQVDLAARVIHLNPKGRQQTNKRRPVVPIADWLLPIVERTLAQIPDKPDAYLLDHAGANRTAFDSACAAAGLADVTPHVLRHTWATWAAQAGVDLWMIAGVLGDSIETVMKTYAHHHPDHLRSAVNLERKAA